jgi:hypothetical protein
VWRLSAIVGDESFDDGDQGTKCIGWVGLLAVSENTWRDCYHESIQRIHANFSGLQARKMVQEK